MRQRHSFRASEWESLEDRNLLSAATVTFPTNLGLVLQQYVQSTLKGQSGQQAQVIATPPVIPNGFIDSRVTLSSTDVSKLATAVNNFYAADKTGTNPTAVANFKASLTALDQFIATEPQKVPGGGTIHVSGATANFILPLLSGSAPSAQDVSTLHTDIDNFAAHFTAGKNPAADTAALNEIQNQMSLLILSHKSGI